MVHEQKRVAVEIRDARVDNAADIARIYNQGIEDRLATLETEPRTAEERAAWLMARGERHPVLVAATGDGAIAGWGSLNPFNPRPAYDRVVDFSVYVDRDLRGSGVGSALLRALEERARSLGYHKMVLAAFSTNTSGMHLYQRRGFNRVGVYREHGLLDDVWVDVVIMEKLLT